MDEIIEEAVETTEDQVEPSKSERNEAGYYRRQLEKAQKELEQIRRSQMSEAERISLERDEAITRAALAEERATTMLLSTKFESEARRAGVPDDLIDLAFQAVDRDVLHVGDDGKVRGLKQAIERLQKDRPTLFLAGQRQPRAGGGNPPGGSGGGSTASRVNAWIRGQL